MINTQKILDNVRSIIQNTHKKMIKNVKYSFYTRKEACAYVLKVRNKSVELLGSYINSMVLNNEINEKQANKLYKECCECVQVFYRVAVRMIGHNLSFSDCVFQHLGGCVWKGLDLLEKELNYLNK